MGWTYVAMGGGDREQGKRTCTSRDKLDIVRYEQLSRTEGIVMSILELTTSQITHRE